MTNPPEESGGTRPSMGMPGIASGATLPIPGNAEFALYAVIEITLILIWIIALVLMAGLGVFSRHSSYLKGQQKVLLDTVRNNISPWMAGQLFNSRARASRQ